MDTKDERTSQRGAEPAVDEPERIRGGRRKKHGGLSWYFYIVAGVAIVLTILVIEGFLSLRSRGKQSDQTSRDQSAGAHTVQVVKPTRSPASFEFSLPGAAEPLTQATLYARVNGYLKQRIVDIGDRVHAGQLLGVIDAPDLDAQLNQARGQLEQYRAAQSIAEITYEREKRLLEQKVVSQQEHDQALATLNQAQANVKAAEAAVQNLGAQQGFEKITAPFDGVITARLLNEGALIAIGGSTTAPAIYTLSQIDVLRVFIYVPQVYVANVMPGQPVEVTAVEYPQKVFSGVVTRVADALDPTARTERVEIQLPSEGGKLLPGMYLSIRFKVQQAEPALIVPADTVDIRREGPRVLVVNPNNEVEYRQVKLGRDFGKTLEIVSGLQGDENLVVNPATSMLNGEKVQIAKPGRSGSGSAGSERAGNP
jgi:multidrug efflux system membrane fusion protein